MIKATQQVAARITAQAEQAADVVDPADHGRVAARTATTTASKKTTEIFGDFTEGLSDVSERYRAHQGPAITLQAILITAPFFSQLIISRTFGGGYEWRGR
jgi:hypothetical protein